VSDIPNPLPAHVADAIAEKALAEAEQARAEAKKARYEAQGAERALREFEIKLEREEHKRARELAGDEFRRVYRFVGPVGPDSAKACMAELEAWSRLDPGCDITLIFQSPGGSIIDGMALWDFLGELRGRGHRLTTIARGYAASMAGILLQAGDERVMGRESWLLIHEASFSAMGSYGDVEDTVKWVEKIQGRILDIFAARSKLSKSQIKRRWHRKDWWIDSDEALKLGFIDRIASGT